MKKIINLCNSALLALMLSSTTSVRAEFQNPAPTSFLDTALIARDGRTECMKIDDSTATSWNAGEICLASDSEVATGLQPAALKGSLAISEDRSSLGAECISAGGSTAGSNDIGGFCLASDLNTSIMDFANFSFSNDLPVAGMQFLQATFADGSTLGAGRSIGPDCISGGGAISTSENGNGFCLVSDLSRSITDFATFAVGNGLPVVSLQFLQVTFAVGESFSSSGTDCVSVGGSTASTTTGGGFCLASDMTTSPTASTSFTVAHDTPVEDLQFLQIMFGGSPAGGSPSSPGVGTASGAECISVEGSLAAIGNPQGFCLVSDLVVASAGSANFAFSNNSSVSGVQFLQVSFASDGSTSGLLPFPGGSTGTDTECVSIDGSVAVAGNTDGFCLVSDLITSATGSANFSVANALPVSAWEFLQVPSPDAAPFGGSSGSPDAPVGIVVSNLMASTFDLRSTPAQAGIGDSQTEYFHLSDQTDGMEATPYLNRYPNIVLWPGR